jgi:hypothetical protein
MATRYTQPAQPSPAMTDECAEAVLPRRLPEPDGSAPPGQMHRMEPACGQDRYRAAAAKAQAIRKRQADAAHWLIARVVNGSGLTARALENEAVITRPGRGGNGSVRIRYTGGGVYHNGTHLGILEGYEPTDGRWIGREEILATLGDNTP